MADEAKLAKENKSSTDDLESNLENDNLDGTQEKRYSLQESNEIGKMMLNSLQSEVKLQPSAQSESVVKVQDPHTRAWKYMEETHSLQMLEILLTKLVHERPDVPVQFMIDEIKKMQDKEIPGYELFPEDSESKRDEDGPE